MSVECARVGDVLRLERLAVEPDPAVEYVTIGIRSFGKGIFHYEPKLGNQLGRLRFFEVSPHRLIVSNIKGWEGAIAISSEADVGCIASNRFLSYTPSDERIDIRWARWYFLSEPGIQQVQRASPGSADRNRTLAIDRFEALEIPLPPIEEQRRVAWELEHLEAASIKLTERVAHANKIATALVVSASARPDLDDHAKARAGWRRVALGDVMRLHNREAEVRSDGSYKIAGVYSFGRGMFSRAEVDGARMSYNVLHQLEADQLVMSRLKAWEGALALVPAELDGWFLSPEFPTFDIDGDQVHHDFLSAIVTSERFWSRLKGASQGIGARRERVSASRLLEQQVDLPPMDDQYAIAKLMAKLKVAQGRRDAMNVRFASLVPAAMNAAFAA